jgi:hypothetical protein
MGNVEATFMAGSHFLESTVRFSPQGKILRSVDCGSCRNQVLILIKWLVKRESNVGPGIYERARNLLCGRRWFPNSKLRQHRLLSVLSNPFELMAWNPIEIVVDAGLSIWAEALQSIAGHFRRSCQGSACAEPPRGQVTRKKSTRWVSEPAPAGKTLRQERRTIR